VELSPEERRRIYEEEKNRLERESRERGQGQAPGDETSTGLKPNVAALLCYVGAWVSGLVFFLIEDRSSFVRFHAAQSIVTFGTLTLAALLLGWIPLAGRVLWAIVGVVAFVVWVVMIVRASNGESYKLPWFGNLAERMLAAAGDREAAEGPGREGAAPAVESGAPEASQEAPGPQADHGRRETRRGLAYRPSDARRNRIASAGAAIVWSIVLLVFFNFFSQYVAYYHDGSATPLLTAGFQVWLPLATTALALSIAGHAVIIVYDDRSLRHGILIALNCLGIATVVTLFRLFPFDFSSLPNANTAAYLALGLKVALIAIAVGFGVGALVRTVTWVLRPD